MAQKKVLLIAGVGDANYVEEYDAYFHGLVVDDTTEVKVLDMVVTRERERAAIYYVLQEEQPGDDDLDGDPKSVEFDVHNEQLELDEAAQPE